MPVTHWLAARWERWGLARVLDEPIADGLLLEHQADEATRFILADTAQHLFRV